MAHPEPGGVHLTERERARLQTWLRRTGRPTQGMTPLLEARYLARYRGQRIQYLTLGALALIVVGWIAGQRVTGTPVPDTSWSLASVITLVASVYAASLVALWYQHRADLRIGASLRHRVARPSVVDLGEMVGRWFFGAAAVVYGGGLLAGGAAVVFAPHGRDRAVAVVFLAGVVLFIGLAMVMLAGATRRPAIAEDDRSLAEDDVLRREDAGSAVAPALPLFALIAGVGSADGSVAVAYLGYAAVAVPVWAIWWRAAATQRDTARFRRPTVREEPRA